MKKTKTETHSILVDGERYTYLLTRKAVKNLNLRVRRDGSIAASAPARVPLSAIEDFIRRHAPLIRDALRRQQEARPAPFLLVEGCTLPVHGDPCRLHFEKSGRFGYRLEAGTLTLLTTDPENKESRKRALDRFLTEEAERTLFPRVAELLPLFAPCPDTLPTLKLRAMTSKWGICRPTSRTVTLNKYLVLVSPALADYVICHELAHFKHPDHSPAFWAHLASVIPDCRERRKALNETRIPLVNT